MSNSTDYAKCPKCGGALVDGYALAPRGLWWDKDKPQFLALGGTSEKIISQWGFRIPSAPSQRCYTCNTITIKIPREF